MYTCKHANMHIPACAFTDVLLFLRKDMYISVVHSYAVTHKPSHTLSHLWEHTNKHAHAVAKVS